MGMFQLIIKTGTDSATGKPEYIFGAAGECTGQEVIETMKKAMEQIQTTGLPNEGKRPAPPKTTEKPLAARIFDPKTYTFRSAPPEASQFEKLSLKEKVCIQRAIREHDNKMMEVRRSYYELKDAGQNPDFIIAELMGKNWRVVKRRGYELHEFVGVVDFNQDTAPRKRPTLTP